MSGVTTVDELDRVLKHAYSEPKAKLALEAPSPVFASLFGDPDDVIDPDWWEPRYDQPWRRQVARDRDEFGGAYVARALDPVEGPRNPNRLRREAQQREEEAQRLRSEIAYLQSQLSQLEAESESRAGLE